MAQEPKFLIGAQSQAEKDSYLVDCFHDSGFLKKIVENDYSVLAGRKGSGKTAIARFLEQKADENDLLVCKRISITSFSDEKSEEKLSGIREKILIFILLTVAKDLLEAGYLLGNSKSYWLDVFTNVGLGKTSTYESFKTKTKKNWVSGGFSFFKGKLEEERTETKLELNSETLFASLADSLDEIGLQTSFLFFIDDLSDYLDDLKKNEITDDIHIIKEVLIRLDIYNTILKDGQKSLRFVACLRDDLFEYMEGSNINKLKSNSLFLEWNEESFAGLIIRRLPHFSGKLEEALNRPIESIKEIFPDEIFSEKLKHFETNRYATNFYAYMIAISFNRPRDFLSFCYAMRNRLSLKHAALEENIDGAEIEYSDYFKGEIRDELYLASKILDFGSDEQFLYKIIDVLSERERFNVNQIRTNIAPVLKTKTKIGRNRIDQFIYRMWSYGILGYKEDEKDKLINFKYISSSKSLIVDNISSSIYYLHRGLWWFARKVKNRN